MPVFGRSPISGWIVPAFLVIAVIAGGGGSPSPVSETILQLSAALLFAAWIATAPAGSFRSVPRSAWWLALLFIILPVIQLVPLPPGLWHGLPGRELEIEALRLVNAQDSWRPLSMSPPRTLASLLAILPAAALLLMTSASDRSTLLRAVAALAGIGLVALTIGAAQVASGIESAARIYDRPEGNFVHGFQAGHNLSATILLVTSLAVAESWRVWTAKLNDDGQRWAALAILAAAQIALFIGVILTGSRAGTALLVLALPAVVWIARPYPLRALGWKGPALLVVFSILAAGLLYNTGFGLRAFLRFHQFGEEARPEIWQDTMLAISQYFPWGTGIGTFTPMFFPTERLESLREVLTNRAHNDYLELLLEAGIPGIIALIGGLIVLAGAGIRGWRTAGTGERGPMRFAIAALAIVALHSIVDYPVRSMSLACVSAFLAGLILALSRATARTPVAEGIIRK